MIKYNLLNMVIYLKFALFYLCLTCNNFMLALVRYAPR